MGDYPEILEREAELAAISGARRAAAAGAGSLLLVTGPGGIGRTALLRAARDDADDPTLVLTARGMALERDFSFGVARQLLEPVIATPGDWDEGDPPAAIHGLYRRVADLAARRPVLIAVDDAHWADAPSLRWLAHLAARVDGLPV
ncbi:MAG: ATP-binding protein, partial [Nocardiopsaceae bacterium]|nr:ATP-binding protein [Nocardiopsaceae bacterium]